MQLLHFYFYYSWHSAILHRDKHKKRGRSNNIQYSGVKHARITVWAASTTRVSLVSGVKHTQHLRVSCREPDVKHCVPSPARDTGDWTAGWKDYYLWLPSLHSPPCFKWCKDCLVCDIHVSASASASQHPGANLTSSSSFTAYKN